MYVIIIKNRGLNLHSPAGHFYWAYHGLLKDKLESLSGILAVSDDERLNTEIKEQLELEYEEKAYRNFMVNPSPGCIYVVHPDDILILLCMNTAGTTKEKIPRRRLS